MKQVNIPQIAEMSYKVFQELRVSELNEVNEEKMFYPQAPFLLVLTPSSLGNYVSKSDMNI